MTPTEKQLIESVKKALYEEGRKYSTAQERNLISIFQQAVAEERARIIKTFVFRDVEYTSLDRMSQASRDNYFYNLSLNQVKDDLISSLDKE